MGPLAGCKVVELVGVGPGPFCAMLLADLGADVIRVTRPVHGAGLDPRADILARGRRSVVIDLKERAGRAEDGDRTALLTRRAHFRSALTIFS